MAGFFLNLLWGWDAFCAPFIKDETCQQDQTIISISQCVFYSVERRMCYFKEYTHTQGGGGVGSGGPTDRLFQALLFIA